MSIIRTCIRHIVLLMVAAWFGICAGVTPAIAGQGMNMPGVENSVGYLSSGTSVQPTTASESTPMIHKTIGNWTAMLHANAFLVEIQQSGPRGGDKLYSANWFMPMLARAFGRQSLTFRAMLSLEPATVTNRQYPLLFQTGEAAYGLSIVDGQHPHDLVMELAARYDFRLNERSQFFAYGGPVGEVALGPTAFPHRSSASENPVSPLGHHQQDSTHIATNVVTLGLSYGRAQIEASTFHGREPNENRWNIDKGKPDSFATRLTLAPHKNVSTQFSVGRINSPEADPEQDTVRTTASLHFNSTLPGGHLASSLIWGRNNDLRNGSRRIFNSYNLEITAKFSRRNWLWTRIENVDRDSSLLPVLPLTGPPCLLCGVLGQQALFNSPVTPIVYEHLVAGPDGRPVLIEEQPIGRIQAYTLGYERELPIGPSWLNTAIGIQATTYGIPSQLKELYGKQPATIAVFLRIRPTGNMSEHMKLMHQGR